MLLRQLYGTSNSIFLFGSAIPKFLSKMASTSSAVSPPTAGIIVIGDEILKGQVQDTNSHFISSRLYNIGVRVMRVSVIGDDVDEICNEVRKFSKLYTYVITSGGIGPTHDDVTFEGVARAFNETVAPHPELMHICSEFYKTKDLSSPVMKLACVPSSAKLTYGFDAVQRCKSKFPNISIGNVYIFPGVPPLLEKSFAMLCEELFGGAGTKFYHNELYLNASEVSIAECLTRIALEYPHVSFGSYPQLFHSYYAVRLTIEAESEGELLKATKALKQALPEGCLVDYDSNPLKSACEKVKLLSNQNNMSHVKIGWGSLLRTLSSFKECEVALCINASLYSVALLHLYYAAQQELQRSSEACPVIVLRDGSSPLDAEQFMEESAGRYPLNIAAGPCDVRTAVSCLHSSCPNVSLVLAGCTSNLSDLQEALDVHYSSKQASIFSPLSAWNDTQLLAFIRGLSLPYWEKNVN